MEAGREPPYSPPCASNRGRGYSAGSNTASLAGCCDDEHFGTSGDFPARPREQPPSPSRCQNEACPRPGCISYSLSSGVEPADGKENIAETRPSSGERTEATNVRDAPLLLASSHQVGQEKGAETRMATCLSKSTGEVGCFEQVLDPLGETMENSAVRATHGREGVVAVPAAGGQSSASGHDCSEDAAGGSAKGTNHAPLRPAAHNETAGRRLDTSSMPRSKIGLAPAKARRGGGAALLSKAPTQFQFSTPDLVKTVLAVRGTVSARRQQQQQPQLLAGPLSHHQQTEPLDRHPSFQQRRTASTEDQDDRSECTAS